MSSSLVVEYLDEVEEGHLGLAATEEVLPKLVLDRGEPALDDGVVVAVPRLFLTHRAPPATAGSLCGAAAAPRVPRSSSPSGCAFYLFIRQPMGRKSALRREIPWILRGFQGRLSC